jgi:hypothetical protein
MSTTRAAGSFDKVMFDKIMFDKVLADKVLLDKVSADKAWPTSLGRQVLARRSAHAHFLTRRGRSNRPHRH